MLPFQNLIAIDKEGTASLYKQVTGRLISLIREGTMPPGTFLPGTRQMAESLGVNRKTIIKAYDELVLQEWVVSVPKKGYRVIPELPSIKPRTFHPKNNFAISDRKMTFNDPDLPGPPGQQLKKNDIVVNDGFPDSDLAPYKEMSNIYLDPEKRALLKQLMSLRDFGGLQLLKQSTSIFLNHTRGLHISSSDVMMTRGAQMAIYLAARTLFNPGDNVVLSQPNYIFADDIMLNCGANIIRVKIDSNGIDTNHLEVILKKTPIKLLYIIPHHHNPTTVTLSAARRKHLLQLIGKYAFWVIEDDYDYDFHYGNSPILPLASAPHGGRVIYIGSFTKLLAPSFRIGYMVATSDVIQKAKQLKRLIDLRGDTYLEYMIAQMLNNGDMTRHIKKSNKLYARRCEFICNLFATRLGHVVSFTRPSGGMAVWLRFDEKFPVSKVISIAASHGLFLVGISYQNPGDFNDNGLRFGFASLSEQEMERSVEILVQVTERLNGQRGV